MKILSRYVLLASVLTLALTALAQNTLRGTWTAEVSSKDSQKVQLNLYRGGHHGQFGQSYTYSELPGLNAAAVAGTNAPVKFQIQHDAGNILFEGEFNKGLGHGEFNFTANAQYLADMKKMGYSEVDGKAFELAALDVSRPFTKEIRDLGFKASLDELIQARIFNVNRAQVEGLKSVGITNPSLDTLVQYRIFDVNPEYVREMRAAFPNVSLDQMVQMRIHKATPEFAREMAKLGYGNLDADQLVAFRIHNVTPEFIREVGELGFKNLDADQLVQFRIFGVNADQIKELAKEGYTNLSADQLVAFRIHNVDTTFIEKVKRAGYKHASPDQLVEFKIMGIRVPDDEL
jgi:cold shock CspA family protein